MAKLVNFLFHPVEIITESDFHVMLSCVGEQGNSCGKCSQRETSLYKEWQSQSFSTRKNLFKL